MPKNIKEAKGHFAKELTTKKQDNMRVNGKLQLWIG